MLAAMDIEFIYDCMRKEIEISVTAKMYALHF